MGLETPSGDEPRDAHVGRKAVDLGLITAHQLAEALQQLASTPAVPNKPTSLSAALVSRGLLTERQVEVLVEGSAAPKRVGKYRIARELGRGGMGVVYEAEDQELHRRVALKMLLSSFQTDPRDAAGEEERFIRESRLSANLPKHPHIVGVYEAGIVEGRRYIAMEYIEGRQFSDWRHDKAVPLRQQIAVLRDVALAVDHAHRHGVIHRDLKPQNILVDAERQPHVTDFGLAKRAQGQAAASLTISGQIMGTPAYMSPEQAEGRKDVDRRSDVWALGVMLYELLAGRLPFIGGTPLDILMKTVKEPVKPPSAVLRGGAPPVERALENVCLKALAKDPKERYAGAAGMANDLDRWLKGKKVGVSAPRKKLPRSWIAAAAGVAAIALAVALLSSTPDADHDHAARSRDYVAQGHALMKKGRFSDALVAFHRAAEEDPGSRAAAAGKKEAEEKMVALGRRDEKPTPVAPSPVPAPVPAPIPVPVPVPVPVAAEDVARKELERRARVQKELAELDLTLHAFMSAENFGPARDFLLQASLRHEDADWKEGVTLRLNDLKGALAALLGPIKARAAESKRIGDASEVEGLRVRVRKWSWPEAALELDETIAKVMTPTPPAVPVPAVVPAPPPAAGAVERPPLRAHASGINVMAFLPDDRTILTASFDHTVLLWDLETRQKRKDLTGGVLPVAGAASLDGRWIGAGLFDATLRVWDVDKLQLRTFSGHGGQVTGLAFTPDGKLAATSCIDGMVRIWDVASAAPKFTSVHLFPKGAMCLGLSLDGKTMAAGGAERMVRVFDVPSGRERKRFDDVHQGVVSCVAVSPDGKWLLTGGQDNKAFLIELSSGRRREAVTFKAAGKHVRAVAFSSDGKWALAASSEGLLFLFDPATGSTIATFKEGDGLFSAAFSRKGDLLAAGTAGGSIRVWDLKPLRPK